MSRSSSKRPALAITTTGPVVAQGAEVVWIAGADLATIAALDVGSGVSALAATTHDQVAAATAAAGVVVLGPDVGVGSRVVVSGEVGRATRIVPD